MIKVEIDYINFEESLHKHFPKVNDCLIYSKNGILNVELYATNIIEELFDELGFDSFGRYIGISFGEWREEVSGERISQQEFYSLEESEGYKYNYVSVTVKLYTDKKYFVCYTNCFDKKMKLSLIPNKLLEFSKNDCEEILYQTLK